MVFCDNCGASLIGDIGIGTRNIVSKSGMLPSAVAAPVSSAGTQTFGQMMRLRLVAETGETLTIQPQQEMILGRRDPATGAQPDIDLTPFAGYRMGVSRRHAAIRRSPDSGLDLWDLGSSNGTYLNGVKLVSYRPNRLHDGDEIRLGQMTMRVYFELPESYSNKPLTANPNAVNNNITPAFGLNKSAPPSPTSNLSAAPAPAAAPAVTANPVPQQPAAKPATPPAPPPAPASAAPADAPRPDNTVPKPPWDRTGAQKAVNEPLRTDPTMPKPPWEQ
ncbi:MAG: FHA domain-containing protein [Anaerolineae bacterium]